MILWWRMETLNCCLASISVTQKVRHTTAANLVRLEDVHWLFELGQLLLEFDGSKSCVFDSAFWSVA